MLRSRRKVPTLITATTRPYFKIQSSCLISLQLPFYFRCIHTLMKAHSEKAVK